jgi:hypothetical protein
MGMDQDDVVLAPYSTVMKRLLAQTYLSGIFASALTEDMTDNATNEITTSTSSLGALHSSILLYKIVSIMLMPELKAIFFANFRLNEFVSPIISVLKPPFAEEQMKISSFL